MTVVFSNPGTLDPRLITTLGVNVKDNPDAIGYFGTGLKYAIAVLLRNDCSITIWSGAAQYVFSLHKDTIRGKEFSFIKMNGQELGFTTELGKNWELWMAYRELYCNALDEGGCVRQYAEGESASVFGELSVQERAMLGATIILVSGKAFDAVHLARSEFILEKPALVTTAACSIYNGVSPHLFYKGIRALQLNKGTLFTYNIHSKLDLTEDRTISYSWEATALIKRTILQLKDKFILEQILLADQKLFLEPTFSFESEAESASEEFLDVVEQLMAKKAALLPDSALKVLLKRRPKEKLIQQVNLTSVQQAVFDKALAFCTKIGLPPTHQIIFVEKLGGNTLACVFQDKIHISLAAFSGGTKTVVKALIEEEAHLTHDLSDCTREMQNFYLDMAVDFAEQLVGEPL